MAMYKLKSIKQHLLFVGFPSGSEVKNPPAVQEMQETRVQFLGWEDPLEEGLATTSGVLPGESHGQSSLMGHNEPDTTEVT